MTGVRHRPWRLLRLFAFGVLVAFLAAALAQRWSQVQPELGRLPVTALAAALSAVTAGVGCTFLAWRSVLADLGSPLSLPLAARVFFVGQLGKYLPGSVWPVVAQMELGRAHRVPPRSSGAAVTVFLLLTLGTGLAVAALTLPLLGAAAYGRYGWVLGVLPIIAVVVYPAVLNRLLNAVLRTLRRPQLPRPLSTAGIAVACAWAVASWLLYGLQVWILARALGAGGATLYLAGTGAMAGAVSAGFLFLVAPAGAGVREVVLVALLAPLLDQPAATALTLVSRLLFTLADALLGGATLLRRSRTASPLAVDPDHEVGEQAEAEQDEARQ